MIKYSQWNWVFNSEKFAGEVLAIGEENGFTASETSEYLGRHTSYLSSLKSQGWTPGLTVVLEICNDLDLDPRDYFEIVRKSDES